MIAQAKKADPPSLKSAHPVLDNCATKGSFVSSVILSQRWMAAQEFICEVNIISSVATEGASEVNTF